MTYSPRLRVHGFSLSVDGYGAGPDQDLEHPVGVGGLGLFEWAFATRTFCRMHGKEGGATGIDDEYAGRGFENIGAWILGRNMFGPVRGPWPDDSWRGWWGDEPPYHTPVFVLTHHPRESIRMAGGTVFHFVTEGIHAALAQLASRTDPFVGLLGPPARRDEILSTLDTGAREALVARLHAPVGLDPGAYGPEALPPSICPRLQRCLAPSPD